MRYEPYFLGIEVTSRAKKPVLRTFHAQGLAHWFDSIYDLEVALEDGVRPTSDRGLHEIASRLKVRNNPSHIPGGVLVVDRKSATLLKQRRQHVIPGVINAYFPYEIGMEMDRAIVGSCGTWLCTSVISAIANLALCFDLARSQFDVFSVEFPDNEGSYPGDTCQGAVQVEPRHVRLEWSGPIPDVFAKALVKLPSPKSLRALEKRHSIISDLFWNKFSPALERPFIEEPAMFSCGVDGHRNFPEYPSFQALTSKRSTPKEILELITEVITISEPAPAIDPKKLNYFGDGTDITFIELARRPTILSSLALTPKTEACLQRILAWSGIKGREARKFTGNRHGDEILGPAILRISQSARTEDTGHESMTRAAKLHERMIDLGICTEDELTDLF